MNKEASAMSTTERGPRGFFPILSFAAVLAACSRPTSPVPAPALPEKPVAAADALPSIKDLPAGLEKSLRDASKAFEAERMVFLKRQEEESAAESRRNRELAAAVKAAGGFDKTLRAEIERLQEEMDRPGADPARRAPLQDKIKAGLRALDVCKDLPDPFIKKGPDVTSPHVDIFLFGCHFGDQKPKVFLEGPFPGSPLEILTATWSDDAVMASIPTLTGVLDSTATLYVVTSTGAKSNEWPFRFRATRDQALFVPPAMQGHCQDGTDKDVCIQAREFTNSFFVKHLSACCINGVSGVDHFWGQLKNGWVLSTFRSPILMPVPPDLAANIPGIYPHPGGGGYIFYNGYATCLASSGKGSLTQIVGPTPGAPDVDVQLAWRVEGTCSEVVYVGLLAIEGPVGVPFQ
jgi:hypothetical protein